MGKKGGKGISPRCGAFAWSVRSSRSITNPACFGSAAIKPYGGEHVYPVYPMCYRTFLNYVSTPPSLLREAEASERLHPPDQLSLF